MHNSQSSEFQPVEMIDGDHNTGLVLLCDHARNTLPERYGNLGLDAKEFTRHIAYDIGAEAVTRKLAERLNAPAVMTRYSRLLVDPNRGEDDPTIIMRLSDGTVIPGNHPMDEAEIKHRIETYHRPYHQAINALIDKVMAGGTVPCIFSVHSFTNNWKGMERPWHVAILWDNDPRMVHPLLDLLREDQSLVVGDNEPYEGALGNDTMFTHGTRRGLAHALIEIRQDLIADEAGVDFWVEKLVPILQKVIQDPALHEVRHFGTRTGIDLGPDRDNELNIDLPQTCDQQ